MGGIFGAVCSGIIKQSAIKNGLKRLIYRGYDGAGVAYIDDLGRIQVRKAPGHIDKVSEKIDLDNIPSSIALGHIRYANRGWPEYRNTHPIQDCSGRIAVVHDGIIENYEEIRSRLEAKGHIFKSTTDTEVIAHLIEEYLASGNPPKEAIARATREMRGLYSYAVVISPEKCIYAVNMGQPIVLGVGSDPKCMYVSSDIPSLYGYAEYAAIARERSLSIVCDTGFKIYDIDTLEEIREIETKRVKYMSEAVDKAGYPHYMLKEIYEIPEAMVRTTVSLMDKYLKLASMIVYGGKDIYIIGNGTSYHAGLVAAYYFSDLAETSVNVISAAEFPYYALDNISTGSVIIAISQSGETSDVINSVKLAKQRGAVIVGVTNVLGSRLTLESNIYLPIGAGPEMAVPATKTFVSTIVALAILASYTGLYTGSYDSNEVNNLVRSIKELSKDISKSMDIMDSKISKIADKLKGWESMYVASSGVNYPIALEGALKFKEASMIHSEGMQLGELRHGPIVLVRKGYPVIFIKPVEEQAIKLYERVAREVLSRGSEIITISQDPEGYGEIIKVNKTSRILSPIVSVIPLQLLAYRLGSVKSLPIDTPPGLAKAITT